MAVPLAMTAVPEGIVKCALIPRRCRWQVLHTTCRRRSLCSGACRLRLKGLFAFVLRMRIAFRPKMFVER